MMGGKGFKLIGVVPLKGCHVQFLSNLKVGEVYQFYTDYEIQLASTLDSIESFVSSTTSNDRSIYSLDNGVELNVSALVGKNGSGKSSLLELLYFVIYKISSTQGYVEKSTEKLSVNLEWFRSMNDIHNLNVAGNNRNSLNILLAHQSYKSVYAFYTDLLRNITIEYPDYFTYLKSRTKEIKQINNAILVTLDEKINKLKEQLEKEEELHSKLNSQLNVSILFSNGSSLYELKIDNGNTSLKNWSDDTALEKKQLSDIDFGSLFYTVSINYSHHSLNSGIMGSWLDALFHKNDGYKTPLVINPKRDKGNFDINKEESFARVRLLSNLISARLNGIGDRQFLLNQKQNIVAVHFTLKSSIKSRPLINIDKIDEGTHLENCIVRIFLLKEVGSPFEKLLEIPYHKYLIDYFIRKFYKIVDTYDGYKDIDKSAIANESANYIEAVYKHYKKDKSHVTFKLKQVVNYFKNQIKFKSKGADFWKFEEKGHLISVTGMKQFCSISKKDNYQKITEKLPPAIFDIDFIFSETENGAALIKQHENGQISIEDIPRFGRLSSGEKQLIHSVQTLLYHVSNLNSIEKIANERIEYSNVNIIFDEIELYFHPDLQRRFIDYLVASIERLKPSKVKGINILFATHSPFILSDIPSSNVLRLINGKPQKQSQQTFAANIYDLLKDDFFLSEGVIGEFAKNKIQKTLKKEEITKEDVEVLELIGDPLLRRIALEKAYEKMKDTSLIEAQIRKLQKQLNQDDNAAD